MGYFTIAGVVLTLIAFIAIPRARTARSYVRGGESHHHLKQCPEEFPRHSSGWLFYLLENEYHA
jgi:hypothetical protein